MASQRDELMTVEQILAELCGVSERTFYRWRELGRAPKGMRLPNRELRCGYDTEQHDGRSRYGYRRAR